RIQSQLNLVLNSNHKEDGIFNLETEKQLKLFQGQNNLPETGMPDQNTLLILDKLSKKSR
ncbi:MAG: peptidoglycan-binding protein, partial [Motiliproteus sp.]|nr:peptidoglycan-binding protein [Motiliproteus sp.]